MIIDLGGMETIADNDGWILRFRWLKIKKLGKSIYVIQFNVCSWSKKTILINIEILYSSENIEMKKI